MSMESADIKRIRDWHALTNGIENRQGWHLAIMHAYCDRTVTPLVHPKHACIADIKGRELLTSEGLPKGRAAFLVKAAA